MSLDMNSDCAGSTCTKATIPTYHHALSRSRIKENQLFSAAYARNVKNSDKISISMKLF
jgi:hypothetical protein